MDLPLAVTQEFYGQEELDFWKKLDKKREQINAQIAHFKKTKEQEYQEYEKQLRYELKNGISFKNEDSEEEKKTEHQKDLLYSQCEGTETVDNVENTRPLKSNRRKHRQGKTSNNLAALLGYPRVQPVDESQQKKGDTKLSSQENTNGRNDAAFASHSKSSPEEYVSPPASVSHSHDKGFEGLITPKFLPLIDPASNHSNSNELLEPTSVHPEPLQTFAMATTLQPKPPHHHQLSSSAEVHHNPGMTSPSAEPTRLLSSSVPPEHEGPEHRRSSSASGEESSQRRSSLRRPNSSEPKSPKKVLFSIDDSVVSPSTSPIAKREKESARSLRKTTTLEVDKYQVVKNKPLKQPVPNGAGMLASSLSGVSASVTGWTSDVSPLRWAMNGGEAKKPSPDDFINVEDDTDMFSFDEEMGAQVKEEEEHEETELEGKYGRDADEEEEIKAEKPLTGSSPHAGSLPIEIKWPGRRESRGVTQPTPYAWITVMELVGGDYDNAILLDDDESSDPDQGFIEFIDLEDYELPRAAGTVPISQAQTLDVKPPIAQMIAPTKPEPVQTNGNHRMPGQAKFESQPKTGAIAARIRKNHGELLRQRAEKLAVPTPIAPVAGEVITRREQQEEQYEPKLMGQKLGFAALTDDCRRRKFSASGFTSDSGEDLPEVITDTSHAAKRYSCGKCNRTYTDHSGIRWHRKNHPNCDTESPCTATTKTNLTEDGRYACEKCGKTYTRNDSVKDHQMSHPDCDTEPLSTAVATTVPTEDGRYAYQIVSKQKYEVKRQRLHDKHKEKLRLVGDHGNETIHFNDCDVAGSTASLFDEREEVPIFTGGELTTEAHGVAVANGAEEYQCDRATNLELGSSIEPKVSHKIPTLAVDSGCSSRLLDSAEPTKVATEAFHAADQTRLERQPGQQVKPLGAESAGGPFLKVQNEVPAPTVELTTNQGMEIEDSDSNNIPLISAEPRPTVAGKGISAATLAAWEAEEDQEEVPNAAYQYRVIRRQWAAESSEDDTVRASEQILGPYHTLLEANAVATKEVYPAKTERCAEHNLTGWSYSYKQDADGLQTHCADVLGLHIETVVHRDLAPPTRRISLPKNAFVTPRCVYVVHELYWDPISQSPTTEENASDALTNMTAHGCFTILDMANKRAADVYLDAFMGNPSENSKQGIQKAELAMEVRKELKELKEDGEAFDKAFEHEVGGWTRIWVTEMVVEGPRN
ncbi:hypothetical protein P7C71_g3268, partial [Lecanoromycetidae sp. Uapishka_2]